jgi:hypothetical protein
MVKSLDQISKALSQLEATTTEIDETIKSIYQNYFTVLGQAVRQQLVLAVYYLCTHAYPEDFLSLSMSQRQKLQAGVRKLATQGQTQIEQLGQVMDVASLAEQLSEVMVTDDESTSEKSSNVLDSMPESDSATNLFPDEIGGGLPLTDSSSDEPSAKTTLNLPDGSDQLSAEVGDHHAGDDDQGDDDFNEASKAATEMIRRLSTSLSLFSVLGTEPLSPMSLAKRHVLLERHIRATLHALSGLANYLLKQAGILPDLPDMVIAAAIEAEAESSGPNTPNVISVLVEMGSDRSDDDSHDPLDDDEDHDNLDTELFTDDDPDKREMTPLVAINLRLADIEFADAQAALWRSRLQEVLMKLKRLGSRYQKIQREKAKAEAEHAWRALWFEE